MDGIQFCVKGANIYRQSGERGRSNGQIEAPTTSHSIDLMTHSCSQLLDNLVNRNKFGMLNWLSVVNPCKLRFQYTKTNSICQNASCNVILIVFNKLDLGFWT